MKFSVLQDTLETALKQASAAVETKPRLPILANILVQTEGDGVWLVGTDLELTIMSRIKAKVDREGSTTLHAKTFKEVVHLLSPERVDFDLDEGVEVTTVLNGTSKNRFKGKPAKEFPPIPTITEYAILIDGGTFREAVREVIYAVAREQARPILTGVHVVIKNNIMKLEASDGYRLAQCHVHIENIEGVEYEAVIPARIWKEAARGDAETIYFDLYQEKAYFMVGDMVLVSQLLEGKYPDFEAIIPKSYVTELDLDRKQLLKALKRAAIFAKDDNLASKIVSTEQGVEIYGVSPERGDLEDQMESDFTGESLTVDVNLKYMQDVLNSFTEDVIRIKGNQWNEAIVMRPVASRGLALIMPVIRQKRG